MDRNILSSNIVTCHVLNLTKHLNGMDQLKFEFGGGALQRYKHLPYKIEYALAEFIDNSIHSFEANAESLMKKFSREHCAVDIFWDSDKHD